MDSIPRTASKATINGPAYSPPAYEYWSYRGSRICIPSISKSLESDSHAHCIVAMHYAATIV